MTAAAVCRQPPPIQYRDRQRLTPGVNCALSCGLPRHLPPPAWPDCLPRARPRPRRSCRGWPA